MPDYVKRYRPIFLKDNITTDKLFTVEKDEMTSATSVFQRLVKNAYVKTADIEGIQKYEQMLEIKPNSDYSLEIRRANILNKLLFKAPFTRQRLNAILYTIYGRGGYVFEIYPDTYTVIIDIDTVVPEIYLQFSDDVRAVIPANMSLIFAIQYTYLYLQRHYKYSELEALTYGELSSYGN